MAEAIVNTTMGDRWQAFSAGTEPSGYVHPKALRVLLEIGIQHQGESKPAHRYRDIDFDLVVTVCDDAAENCPVWLGKGRRVHVGFPDPAEASGTEEQILAVFRRVRDDIAARIPKILAQINE
jgi:arsenate reductase